MLKNVLLLSKSERILGTNKYPMFSTKVSSLAKTKYQQKNLSFDN